MYIYHPYLSRHLACLVPTESLNSLIGHVASCQISSFLFVMCREILWHIHKAEIHVSYSFVDVYTCDTVIANLSRAYYA